MQTYNKTGRKITTICLKCLTYGLVRDWDEDNENIHVQGY